MKKILLFGLLFTSLFASATKRYVSIAGSNTTGTGTSGLPWRTLLYAAANTSAPDTIVIGAGTFLETALVSLPVGVSLEGAGVTTILQSSLTAYATPLLQLSSAEGTDGSQHISNILFDGRSLATSWAVQIQGRSNVSIYNCTIQNFQDRGIIWGGRTDNGNGAPGVYATGNSFHDNIINNSATCSNVLGYGTGCLGIGGQYGMLVYNNTITQNQRSANNNGWPIKYWNEGHLKGCKIYNNTLTGQPLVDGSNGENSFWDFGIELFYESGIEIYGNTMTGSIDLNYNTKDTFAYAYHVHDNLIGFSTFQASRQSGIILEFDSETGIVENNIIRNCVDGIVFSMRPNSQVSNITIRKNLIYNIGSTGGGYGCPIGNFTDGTASWNIVNMNIYNNTVVAHSNPAYAPFFGIQFFDSDGISGLNIKNNIVQGMNDGCLVIQPASIVSTSAFTYNNFYGNGFNTPFTTWEGTQNPPGGNTISNNLSVDPLFVSATNFNLQTSSTLIDAGINVGLAYSGAAPDINYTEYGNPNQFPVANAGANQSITLPTASIILTGSGTDNDGTISTYSWTRISGPNTPTLSGSTTTTLTIGATGTAMIAGTYVYQLEVTDNQAATHTDQVTIVVNPVLGAPGNRTDRFILRIFKN